MLLLNLFFYWVVVNAIYDIAQTIARATKLTP
jgi:hypothetical protein